MGGMHTYLEELVTDKSQSCDVESPATGKQPKFSMVS